MTTDEKNQLFINLLARNLYRFAYWAENEWPGRDKTDRGEQNRHPNDS